MSISFFNKNSGVDISEYFDNVLLPAQNNANSVSRAVLKLPSNIELSMPSIAKSLFHHSDQLREIPYFDTSNATEMQAMCNGCNNLETVPILDTSKITTFQNAFSDCGKLTNESLNNIMKMCINATSFEGTKTLRHLGLSQTQITVCQGLSNYEDLLAAGWTTGY